VFDRHYPILIVPRHIGMASIECKVMLKWILKKWDLRCGLQPAYKRIVWHVLVDMISLKNEGGGGDFLH
jgi:hypothetical protein